MTRKLSSLQDLAGFDYFRTSAVFFTLDIYRIVGVIHGVR